MKNVVLYLDVNEPIGNVYSGGMVVIGGNAPTWKFCNLFYKCVMDGAAVVATGIGIEKSTNGNDYTVAYSTDEAYQIGKPIRVDLNAKDGMGDTHEFTDGLQDTRNLVQLEDAVYRSPFRFVRTV